MDVARSSERLAGHAFISYVHQDSARVDQLQQMLEAAGIPVWRDTGSLWPGEDWRMKIRSAITDDALVFIACFSAQSTARDKSYQNEELALAIEQLRQRRPDIPWLIPVRFDECQVPDIDLGGGRTLGSLHRADLFGEHRDTAGTRLLTTVVRLLGQPLPEQESSVNSDELDDRSADLNEVGASRRSTSDILAERFRAQWADDISLFTRLEQQPSFQDASVALRRSSELNIISKHGIRAPFEGMSIYIRIPHPDEWPGDSAIPLHLEERWMENITTCEWSSDQSFVDVFFSIAAELRSTGHWAMPLSQS